MTDIFFTADLHFHHKSILVHHWKRPGGTIGATTDESIRWMNERLIENWNAVVGRRDEVWVLGDFSFGTPEQKAKTFARLNGSKHLIAGNHDNNATKRLHWASVHDLYSWKQKPHHATLCHYPLLTWNRAHYGSWMLHGHSHGLLKPTTTTRMDVGVDCHPEYRPFHLDEIADYMEGRSYEVVDGHR